jgi:alpha-amylase
MLRLLRYDRYARRSFRCYFFAKGKTVDNFFALELGEWKDPAKAAWSIADVTAHDVRFAWKSQPEVGIELAKAFSWREEGTDFALTCRLEIQNHSAQALEGAVGLELIVNLLAANSPDRYWVLTAAAAPQAGPGAGHSGGRQEPLAWLGEIPASSVRAVDEWDRLRLDISAPGAACFWIVPIWTVSQSESGFDAVYQGSSVMPVWDGGVPARDKREVEITVRLSPLP